MLALLSRLPPYPPAGRAHPRPLQLQVQARIIVHDSRLPRAQLQQPMPPRSIHSASNHTGAQATLVTWVRVLVGIEANSSFAKLASRTRTGIRIASISSEAALIYSSQPPRARLTSTVAVPCGYNRKHESSAACKIQASVIQQC